MPSHENFVPFGTPGKKSKRSQIADAGGGMLDAAFPQHAEQSPPTSDPDGLVTELAATDTELGVIKSGKEADLFLTLVRPGR